GRWNSPGRSMVYAASSSALAVLEVRVHLDLPPDLIPADYRLMKIDLAGLTVETVPDLPQEPRAFGDRWLAERRSPVLAVPSVVAPESTNLLVNPLHPEGAGHVVSTQPFTFDPRLWLPL